MTTFGDREKAFESKFKQDQELQFKVRNRRNKLLGLWAAAKLGVPADAYAKEVVASDFDKPGEEDVVEKVSKDFKAKGINVSDAEIRAEMDRLLPEAKQQLMSETK